MHSPEEPASRDLDRGGGRMEWSCLPSEEPVWLGKGSEVEYR